VTRPALSLLLLLAGTVGHAGSAEYRLSVSGDGLTPTSLSIAELEALPAQKASVHQADGTIAVYAGPSLIDVLKKAGLTVGNHPGKAMSAYVSVTASDAYEVVFGLGEVIPTISGRSILLATSMNGKPLAENDGPVRVVVDGDKAMARSERMVTGIKLVQLRK
jgi:DMSO/TMAO reductase YedYZ molybdopterin-dependent catalytic subunit